MVRQAFRFGTVGSPLSTPKKPGGSVGAIQRLVELGLDALELGWVQSVRVTEQTCALIRQTSEQNDVQISVHAPYFINLNALDEEWPKSRKRLMDAAHYGNLAGATDIVFHPGSYFGAPAGEVLKTVLPRLEGCLEEIRAAGNPVLLRPEAMGKTAVIGSLEDVLELSRLPGVQPCMDFAHLHARATDGTMNTYEEWMRVLEAYERALGAQALKQMHIHLSGIEYGDKGEKNHLVMEEADLDFRALLRALQAAGAGGRLLCESPVMEVDALKFRELWMEVSGESL